MNPPTTVARAPSSEAPAAGHPVVRLVYRDGQGALHRDWPAARMDEALRNEAGLLWVDISGPDEPANGQVEGWLRDLFHFHPLAVEDALRETHVPRIDDWGDYLYIVFHIARIVPQSDVMELRELDIFLGPTYLVTYHNGPLPFLEQYRSGIERDPRDRLGHGADHLLFQLLELGVDQSLAAIEHLDERVDAIQNIVIEHPTPKVLQRIFRVKRSAIRLHKSLGPQREVLNRLARDPHKTIQPQHRVYFRDLYDHVVRIHDISESLRDLITGALETYLSVVSNRTNDIMKILTIVTVMFLPMSFLTSFFGMNFFGESLAFKSPLPRALLFVATCVIMAISPCFIWIYARRREWF
jgi:magnesium transporter